MTTRFAIAALLVTAARGAQAGPAPTPPTAPALAIAGATIYAAPDAIPIYDGVVVVEGGKIVAVGPRAAVTIPAGARTIDATGRFLVAGFQNSHVHFTEARWTDAATQPAANLEAELQAMLTRWGVTTAVDTGSFLANTVALRRAIEAGAVAGPRILTAGEPLYPPDGVPFYLKGTIPDAVLAALPQPRNGVHAAAIVEQHAREGADLTKLFTGAWVERDGKRMVMPMPVETAIAAAAAAHARGELVFSHASNVAGMEVAIAAGVDVLAHPLDDTRGTTPEMWRRMHEQKVAMVSSLKLFGEGRYLWDILDELRDYARAGGVILFGTNVGYLSDSDPTTEYALMAAAGLSWREILAALTTAPAARFGEAARRGRVAVGLDGDLVLLARDPVRDARAFAAVELTVRGGRVIYEKAND